MKVKQNMYNCENCGKLVTEKFGSGRFCSRSCANTRHHSKETRNKIKDSLNKETICSCNFCGQQFESLCKLGSHKKFCSSNPNRLSYKPNEEKINERKQLKIAKNVILDKNIIFWI